jgi:putative transposase
VSNVLNREVLASCETRHRHWEFLAILRQIDRTVPAELDVHRISDNYATHNHLKVKALLAIKPRWRLHFIPTYSSWLNQAERIFSLITDKVIRRGSFASVTHSLSTDHFAQAHNTNCHPFK